MRKTLTTLAVSLLLASPAQGVRIWFSRTGVAEHKAIDGTPVEYFLQQNPEIQAGATDTTRLYVWGTLEGPFAIYMHVCLDVNVYPQAGDVSIVDSRFYNYYGVIYPQSQRWEFVEQGTLTPTQLDDAWMVTVFPSRWGLSYRAGIAGDAQYDPETLSMLLGYVDLEMTPDAQAEVFFGLGQYGFHSSPSALEIFFGWGDGPILAPLNPYGQQSTLPDAYIVPEPATLWLCVLAGLTALRRRRRPLWVPRWRFGLG